VLVDGHSLIENRGHNPTQSTLGGMLAMHRQLDIARVGFTQQLVYWTDNSAILDAVARILDQGRAVVAVDAGVTDDQLADLHRRGARGITLNLDNGSGTPVELDEIPALARALIETNPERMLRATDWPRSNKFHQQPNDADFSRYWSFGRRTSKRGDRSWWTTLPSDMGSKGEPR
jgi:predicted TIM-barrel fold metal-dependent hydrolase